MPGLMGVDILREVPAGFILRADDLETHDLIASQMECWRNMELNHPDGRVVLDGIGFAAVGRLQLLQSLQARAEALGAELRDPHLGDLSALDGVLIIGAEGLTGWTRRRSRWRWGEGTVRGADRAAVARQEGQGMSAVLEIRSLNKSFGSIEATDDLTLSVERGELHAIIGPNGAGKTTLVRQLSCK